MNKTKDEINKDVRKVLQGCLENKEKGGSIIADMGSGKTLMGIDFGLKDYKAKSILVVSPRGNLTGHLKDGENSWEKEIKKWYPNELSKFTLETIQTAYKWKNKSFDVVILDEVHTIMTEKYSDLLKNNKFGFILGLTGTEGVDIAGKQDLYDTYAPIVYTYKDSAEDGLINKTRILVFERTLNNDFKVKSGSKKKSFMQGEFDRYEYLSNQIKRGQTLMAIAGSDDFWQDGVDWFYKNNAPNSKARIAAMTYLNAIRMRKKLLHNTSSGVFYAKHLKQQILKKNTTNKVLIFAEENAQVAKITDQLYYSKQSKAKNNENLTKFEDSDIRELGSSKGLTLGLNIDGANHAILESYVGSKTDQSQKKGRLHRLKKDEVATFIILKITGTQSEQWFNKIIEGFNTEDIQYFTNMNDLIKKL